MSKEYSYRELEELYDQGFFKNTKESELIEDEIQELKSSLIIKHSKALTKVIDDILIEENIRDVSQYYHDLIDNRRLTRVNTAIFAFIGYIKKHYPELISNKDSLRHSNYVDLEKLRLQFKDARDLFSDIYDLYKTYYTRNKFPYVNQRLFLEKLSKFPYLYKIDDGKELNPKYIK